jgi:hypothetical protein
LKPDDVMESFFENGDEVFAIAAAVLVMFTAMLDPRMSLAIAGLFLVAFSIKKILTGSEKKAKRRR